MSGLFLDHASLPVAELRVTPPTAPTRHVFRNETEYFVATSLAHAEQRCREFNNEGPGEDDDGRVSCGPWEQLPDDAILSVHDEDTGQRHVFPCSWWAADPDNKTGFIATTEW